MTQFLKPFEPIAGGTLKPSLSTTATVLSGTNGDLREDANTVVITNTDSAIIVFWRCGPVGSDGTGMSVAVADQDLPILPGQQIRVTVPIGKKKYSMVAASGTPVVYVTPGKGN